MEQTDTQVLNIKLGEWAGIVHFGLSFTDSLDACFKYLVPMMVETIGKARTMRVLERWSTIVVIHARKPALTLCLKIEEAIDEISIKGVEK